MTVTYHPFLRGLLQYFAFPHLKVLQVCTKVSVKRTTVCTSGPNLSTCKTVRCQKPQESVQPTKIKAKKLTFFVRYFSISLYPTLVPSINCIDKTSELYRVSLSLEAPNYCLCIQSKSAGFSFVNTGKQVHLKHARRHFERNLVKDVHHRSVASRNWLKS